MGSIHGPDPVDGWCCHFRTVILSQPNCRHVTNCSFKGHALLCFAQGRGGSGGCGSRVASVRPRLSPIIHFPLRFVLLTCLKIAEMGWTQTCPPPPLKSPGWSACQRAASPSASVSHKTSNLFGRQMTLLSLVSRGPLRVRRILFGSGGSRGDPDFSDQTHGPLQMWGYDLSRL